MTNLKIWDLVLISAKTDDDGQVTHWLYVTNDDTFNGEVAIEKTKQEDFEKDVKAGKITTEIWKQLLWATGDFVSHGKQDNQDD